MKIVTENNYWTTKKVNENLVKKLIKKTFYYLGFEISKIKKSKEFVSYQTDNRIIKNRNILISNIMYNYFKFYNIKTKKNNLIKEIKKFEVIFRKSHINDLRGGISYNQALIIFLIIKITNPKFIIESGVWKGFGTYIIDKAREKKSQLYCFDINLKNLIYKSNKANYFEKDIENIKFSFDPSRTLVIFDDHVSHIDRVKYINKKKIKFSIFDDDYSIYNFHGDGWPALPTLNMIFNKEKVNKIINNISWILNENNAKFQYKQKINFNNKIYKYSSFPNLYNLTGYQDNSPTSLLIKLR